MSLIAIGFGIWWRLRQPLPDGAFWFASLFLVFFLVFLLLAVMRLFGRIEISVYGNQGTVFIGAGTIGRTLYFDWSESLEISGEHMTSRGVEFHEIVLHGASSIRTGKFLTKEQATAVIRALRGLQAAQKEETASQLARNGRPKR